jgi:hypothetical protein
MSFGWGDVGKLVLGVAPTLAGALMGPFGAIAGTVLSTALGAAEGTPDTVMQIIQQGGAAVTTAIQQTEATAQAKWGYLSAGTTSDGQQGAAINTTMQSEYAAGVSWWHWRHLMGYLTMVWFIFPVPPVAWAFWTSNLNSVAAMTAALVALLPFYTILSGLCGYVAMDTSRRIAAAQAGSPVTTAFSSILGLFKKK